MAVRFVIGRAGTGKTRHCIERIKEMAEADPLGPVIYWVLPRQATFQAERELTAELTAFARVRVVSFELLGRDILQACGDVKMPALTAGGRRLVIGHLLRLHQDALSFYGPSAHHPGLAGELDGIFGELDQAGLDAAALKSALDSAAAPLPRSLEEKLADLQLLLREYEAFLGTDRLDPARRFKRVLDRVKLCGSLNQATLLVDDFYDFTANERNLLVAVAAAVKDADITLLMDPTSAVLADPHQYPDELSPLHRTERTYRSLFWALTKQGVKIDPPMKLGPSHRTAHADLLHLQQNEQTPFAAEPLHIQWIEAPDVRAEVDAVARKIDDLLVDGSLRRRDIAVLARQMNGYQEHIESSFREHRRLSYYIDRRRPAIHHPLLRFCRTALLLADGRWATDSILSLLKTGLAGVTDAQIDAMENYAISHRIRGGRWASSEPWTFRTDEAPEAIGGIDAARQAVATNLQPILGMFGKGNTPAVHDVLMELFALLERFKIRQSLSGWIAAAETSGHLEQAQEHRAVWGELTELLQHFDDLLGPTSINLDDFFSILDAGLERFDLGITPATVDQIIVGEIGRTRLPEVKVVFVLGLNEKLFPKVGAENVVLSDSERRVLRERQIEVSPETDRQLLDESLLAYVAFSQPSQQLVLSRYTTESGGRAQPTNASAFWSRTRAMFPAGQVHHISRHAELQPADIATPRQLVTALMHWARDANESAAWPALYDWFTRRPHDADDPVAELRRSAWPALSYRNDARVPAPLAGPLFGLPLQVSASQLQRQATCPYQHYAADGLSLHARAKADFTSLDLHNAYADALRLFTEQLKTDHRDWNDLEEVEIADRLSPVVELIGQALRGKMLLGTARSRYVLQRIGRMLRLTILAQQAMLRRGQFSPTAAGLKFGDNGKILPLVLPLGEHQVRVNGSVPRLDLLPDRSAFAIYHYTQSSKKPLSLSDVKNGLSLQLMTSVLALRESGAARGKQAAEPAGAFYVSVTRTPVKVPHPDEAKTPGTEAFNLQAKPRGILQQDYAARFDRATRGGETSPVLSFRLTNDGNPGYANQTDIVTRDQFDALLIQVRNTLIELSDQILNGFVAVEPYRKGQATPCGFCAYRAVCRFEPGRNSYRELDGGTRSEILQQLSDGGDADVE